MATRDLAERSLPHNLEVEKSILGAVLLDNQAFNTAAQIVRPDDFFSDANRLIFEAMSALSERAEVIDPVTLREELQRRDTFERAGGSAYVAALVDGLPHSVNVEQYARIVKDKSALRQLIDSANRIMREAMDGSEDTDELLDRAEHAIFQISEDKIRKGFVPTRDLAVSTMEEIEQLQQHGDHVTGIGTGYARLDQMTAGLQRGDLVILAARPSMGKCLTADAEIVLQDGSLATIEEVVRRQAGPVPTLRDDLKLDWATPSAFVDDGIKPAFEVRTRLGREVTTTLTHPFLTLDGWQPLGALQEGDRIAVPRRLEAFGTAEIREEELGALARRIGGQAADSDDARIPDDVFRLRRRHLARFLSFLFSTARRGVESRCWGSSSVLVTASQGLGAQVQHLLLRFGIVGRCSRAWIGHGRERRVGWKLALEDRDSLEVFARELMARPARRAAAGGACVDGAAAARAPFARTPFDSASTNRPARPRGPDVQWDEIVSIEPVGDRQVYDLTIPDTHNFVANDICVHNTALALNIAQNVALPRAGGNREPGVVGFFSLEMSKEQVMRRLVTAEAQVDAHKLATGFLSKEEIDKLVNSLDRLSNAPVFIDDTAGATVLEMRAKTRRLKAEHGCDLVVVDYLQLVRAPGRHENRNLEIGEISRSLKAMAKEMEIPVLALSQLSRAPESRSGHRPQLSDLRECVTGDTLVHLTDGSRVPIRRLVGETPEVVAMSPEGGLVGAISDKVWPVGRRPVHVLRLASDRMLRTTGLHRLYGPEGWRRVGELRPGDQVRAQDGDGLVWDRVVSVEPDGEEDVYDLTVPGPASWVGNSVISHNSGNLEQDADVVSFIFRPEIYDREDPELEGQAELIISKQRNGPIGSVPLVFLKKFTLFRDRAEGMGEEDWG